MLSTVGKTRPKVLRNSKKKQLLWLQLPRARQCLLPKILPNRCDICSRSDMLFAMRKQRPAIQKEARREVVLRRASPGSLRAVAEAPGSCCKSCCAQMLEGIQPTARVPSSNEARGIFSIPRACKRSCPNMPEACLCMSHPRCRCWWREGGWVQAAQAGPAQDPAAKMHSGPKIGGRGHGTAHAVGARGLVSFQELGLARRCSALLLAGHPCVLQNQGLVEGDNRLKRLRCLSPSPCPSPMRFTRFAQSYFTTSCFERTY